MNVPTEITELVTSPTSRNHKVVAAHGVPATPRFLQGVFPFAGRGVYSTTPLSDNLSYSIPQDHVGRIIYFRAGNLSDDILYLTITIDSHAIRYFPVGPKSDIHVPLAIVESYPAGSRIEVCIGAPTGLNGAVVIDVGILEVASL